MPFRRPCFDLHDKTVKAQFGESVEQLRYSVVSVVVPECLDTSKEAMKVEFGMQAKVGLSYGALYQKVPSGSPHPNDDEHNNHCIVIHFLCWLGQDDNPKPIQSLATDHGASG